MDMQPSRFLTVQQIFVILKELSAQATATIDTMSENDYDRRAQLAGLAGLANDIAMVATAAVIISRRSRGSLRDE